MHFAEQSSLTEHGVRSGRSKEDSHLSGVRLILKISLARELTSLPVGHLDHLMYLCFALQDNQFTTIISMYAPTLMADPATKESVYRDLRSLLSKVDSGDKLIIMGDFNLRLGNEHTVWSAEKTEHQQASGEEDRVQRGAPDQT